VFCARLRASGIALYSQQVGNNEDQDRANICIKLTITINKPASAHFSELF